MRVYNVYYTMLVNNLLYCGCRVVSCLVEVMNPGCELLQII
jgi:hypothetical protein